MCGLRTGYRPDESILCTWLQVAKTLPEQISQYAQVVLQTLAYAGTGDVLQIQSLLAMCGEHTEVDENAAWKVSGSHTDQLCCPAVRAPACPGICNLVVRRALCAHCPRRTFPLPATTCTATVRVRGRSAASPHPAAGFLAPDPQQLPACSLWPKSKA